MGPIYQGNTEKCLVHFRDARFNENKEVALADFCKVTVKTVANWFVSGKGRLFPTGANLIRLRYYLDMLGYQVTELKSLARSIYVVGSLLALGLTDLDDLVKALGMPNTTGGRSQLLAILRGEQHPSPERLGKFDKYAKESGPLADEARKSVKLLTYLGDKPTARPVSAVPAAAPAPAVAKEHRHPAKDPIVGSLADMIKAMLPLARVVASKDYSAEDRNRLREITGKGTIFEASNLLSNLCSETALGLNSAKNK